MNVVATVDLLSLYGFPLVKRIAVPMHQTNTSTCIYVSSDGLYTMDMYYLVTTHALDSRKERAIESFRLDEDLVHYYMNSKKNGFRTRTELINRSIRLMIMFKDNPLEVLKILKEQNSELYKKIGRKKFRW